MKTTRTAMMETTTTTTMPEDIHAEILKRLPVRTLVRFSCVCKTWRRLLTDPSFVSTHLRVHSPTRIILSRYCKTIVTIPIPQNPNPPNSPIPAQQLHLPPLSLMDGDTYYVKGHCHGLLCLILSDGTILLWNPTIRHHKTLPSPPNFNKTREVLGIGFDPSLNDYKIIRFPSAYCKSKVIDYHPQVEVFTLGSNSWRKLPDEDTPPFFVEHYQQSVALNGAVYWLTLDNYSSVILRFDLAEEKFSAVPLPPDDAGMNLSWVGVLKDSLCVIHAHRGDHFDVWATQDERNWNKMVTVSEITDPGLEPPLSTVDYVPLCFVESGELVMSVRGKGLAAYDPGRGRYRKFAAMEDDARWLQETAYTDTLVSPHGYGGGSGDDDDDGQLLQQQQGSSIGFARNLWEMLVRHWWRGSATK